MRTTPHEPLIVMDKKPYGGFKRGELIICCAGSGVGKSMYCKIISM